MYRLSVMRRVRGAIVAAAGFVTFMASAVDIGANTTWTAADAATHSNDDIAIASGVTLTVNLAASETATLGGVISGAGALKLTGSGTLTLAGANEFAGGFYLASGATVCARTATALGAGTVHVDGTGWVCLQKDGATFANDFDFTALGFLCFSPTAANAAMTVSGAITASSHFCIATSYKGDDSSAEAKLAGCLFTFDNTITAPDHYLTLVGYHANSSMTVHFNKKITAAAVRCNNAARKAVPDTSLYGYGPGYGKIYFHAANEIGRVVPYWNSFYLKDGGSFGTAATLTSADMRQGEYHHGGTIYLGSSQEVASIRLLDNASGYQFASGYGNLRCDSDSSPRTLTVSGGGSYVTDWKLMDKMSLDWNPPETADTLTLSNAAHTTSGKITVSKGAVVVRGTLASLASLTALEVKENAAFELDTPVASPLAKLAGLTVSDTSSVTLPAGTTCVLSSLTLNGRKQLGGTFKSEDCDWLKGEGVVLTVANSEWTKADVEALTEGVTIPAGCQLTVKTAAGETITFAQKISGAGSLRVIGDGEIVFSAANDYAGGLFVDGASTVRGTDGAAFGTGAVQLGGKKAVVYLQTGSATFANDFTFTNNAVIAFVPTADNAQITVGGTVTATADFYVALSEKGVATARSGASYTFAGPINAAGKAMTFMGTLGKAVDVNFRGPIAAARVRSFSLSSNGPYDSLFGTGWGYSQYNLSRYYFYAANAVDVFVPYWTTFCPKHPQAFTAISTLSSSDYRKDAGYHHSSGVDFGGLSMTVGSLEMLDINGYAIGKESDCGVLTSSQAATLTVGGGGTYVSDAILKGALSLDWNPPDAADMIILSNRAHTTTGKLTVSKGTAYAVGEKVSFKNLTAIQVKSGATFRLDTAVANALTAVREVTVEAGGLLEVVGGATPFAGGLAVVDVQTNETACGRISLASGSGAKFMLVRVNGEAVPEGKYAAADTPWLEGAGEVTVDMSGSSENVWLNVRDGHFGTAANWSKNAAPNTAYPTVVNAAGPSYVVALDQDAGSIGSFRISNATEGKTATLAVSAALQAEQVTVGKGGVIAVSSGGLLQAKTNANVCVMTVEDGGAIELTGGQLRVSAYGWGGDGLVVRKGGKLDVSGDAVIGPMDGTTYTKFFGDGEITFRGHSTFGRTVTGGAGGWGYAFATGSGSPTGTVNFIEHARFYDTSSSLKFDRGPNTVAQVILGSATNHTFNWKTYVGGGDGGRGELVVTNGVLTQGGEGMHVGGAYEKQGATAALTSEGFLRVAGRCEVDFFTSNKATGDFCGLVVGDGVIATTNKTTGLGYGDTMRGFVEIADEALLQFGSSATLIIGVGSPNAFGRLIQTGGTLNDLSESEYGPAAVGMGGGTGEWLMSGGTALLKCNLYVGGALLADDFHRTAPPSNGGRLYIGERDYPGQAKGLLKLTGGAMTLRQDLILSKDGEGTLELGPGGKLTVDGTLNALAGSKLVVDITGYAGRSRMIATFGSVTRWFDTVELKGETEGYAVLVDPAKGRVSVKHLVGSVLMVR